MSNGVDTDSPRGGVRSSPTHDNNHSAALSSSAAEDLTGKRLGKCARLLFTFKTDPADICARNLPETDGLEFHMIEPSSHLAQLMGQVSGVDSYFGNVEH